ncbi:hypothetical protein GGE45_004337 [Rhizobium aethiopicum]|uniref:Uncharacterized protein n=1 Tax=Rhizobium aethiopicum TaxID=1138170 RepID=A0A7W6MJ63_9HYPH|nr:hypothetical protein [Rhizobium aethiopicum]MBB4581984.1 hypothetical protein [Rhizobium aethiopicum]
MTEVAKAAMEVAGTVAEETVEEETRSNGNR